MLVIEQVRRVNYIFEFMEKYGSKSIIITIGYRNMISYIIHCSMHTSKKGFYKSTLEEVENVPSFDLLRTASTPELTLEKSLLKQ
jgi:hypothetical protein